MLCKFRLVWSLIDLLLTIRAIIKRSLVRSCWIAARGMPRIALTCFCSAFIVAFATFSGF